jgi:hypothetical protein
MNQQARFEAFYAKQHDIDPEDVAGYRLGDTYRLPKMAAHYRTFKAAEAQLEGLRAFADELVNIALEGANADGDHIQDLAVKHGLLTPEQRTERCGDACSCAEYSDFPVECFRKISILKAVTA